MNKVLYVLFGIVLVATLVLGGIYLATSNEPLVGSTSTPEPEDVAFTGVDNALNQVETAVFVSAAFAFQYPDTWKPEVVNQNTGEVNLGIPSLGIIEESLSFEQGSYEDIKAGSSAIPNLAGEATHTLVDREGYSRILSDDLLETETYEFFAPGRNSNEYVRLAVKVDTREIFSGGIGIYLVDIFEGLTILQ